MRSLFGNMGPVPLLYLLFVVGMYLPPRAESCDAFTARALRWQALGLQRVLTTDPSEVDALEAGR